MNMSFCIVTDGKNPDRVNTIIESIISQDGLQDLFHFNYEIIVVGGDKPNYNVRHIPFDESISCAFTKKKNICFKTAKYEYLTIGHDYISYEPGFFKSFQDFGDFDVAMVKIKNVDGSRFRDWIVWNTPIGHEPNDQTLQWIDYDDSSQIRNQYVSGAFWVAKKQFQLEFLIDETKEWGKSEDVAMSYAMRPYWNYRMNKNASVKFLKQKDNWPPKTPFYKWKPEYELN